MLKPRDRFTTLSVGMVGLFFIALGVGGCVVNNYDPRDAVIHVREKDLGVKAGKTPGTKYMVFTEEGVFESRDSLWQWKWDSADVYARLTPGKAYQVRACGVRWPFFSIFPNIVKVDKELEQ